MVVEHDELDLVLYISAATFLLPVSIFCKFVFLKLSPFDEKLQNATISSGACGIQEIDALCNIKRLRSTIVIPV